MTSFTLAGFRSLTTRCASSSLGLSRAIRFVLSAALAATLFAQSTTAVATPVLIDDFVALTGPGNYVIGLLQSNPYLLKQPGGIGGERDLLVTVLGAAGPVSAVGTVGGGSFQFGTAGPLASKATLQYDGFDPDTAGALVNALGLNANLLDGGNNNGLRLEFGSVDGGSANGLLVDITLTSAGGGASFVGIIPDNPNPQNYDVLFSAFATTPGFSFAAVTSVQLTFNNNGATNADFNLRRIEAQGNLVPEPGSIVLAVVGLIGCLAYVRRRSRV